MSARTRHNGDGALGIEVRCPRRAPLLALKHGILRDVLSSVCGGRSQSAPSWGLQWPARSASPAFWGAAPRSVGPQAPRQRWCSPVDPASAIEVLAGVAHLQLVLELGYLRDSSQHLLAVGGCHYFDSIEAFLTGHHVFM